MQYFKAFEQIGFAPSETKVYVALLELDSAGVTEIAKKSGINRTSCYDVLQHLMKRGLVSKFKKRSKIYFSAGNPSRLLAYLDREKEEVETSIEAKKEQMRRVLPELSSLMLPQATKPKVSFYEGEQGMREAYEDTLSAQDGIFAYANVQTMHEGLPNFFPEYYKRRTEAGISIRAIMPQNPASANRAKKDKEELRESIVVDEQMLSFSPEVNIYNNKMLIASWKEKMAVIIESKELADLQRQTHQLLWKLLKKDGNI